MEGIGILLVVLAAILINLLFASLMNAVAVNKGYENSRAFLLVFFFSVFGIRRLNRFI